MAKPRKLSSALLSLALSLALILTLLPAAAGAVGETGTTDIWKWKVLDDGTLSITGCTALSADMALPAALDAGSGPVTVTRIESNAFKVSDPIFFPSKIVTFSMPDSVTDIGDNAFYKCTTMTSVTLPNNLQTIGASAFYNCKALTAIKIRDSETNIIPDSVTGIGSAAFAGCSALESITLPNNPGFTNIPDNLFNGDYSLTTVNNISSLIYLESIGSQAFFDSGIESILLPDSVTSIGEGAFDACRSLESVTLPDNAAFTAIPDRLFFNCEALQSLTIPKNVTSIGADALNGCNALTEIVVDGDNTAFSSEDGVLYNADKTTLIRHPAGRAGTLDIPGSVTKVGDYAFLDSKTLTDVSIPGSVTEIGEGAFFNCNNAVFEEPVIPGSVTSIGAYAFNACNRLTEVTVPEGIESLGEYTFFNCLDLPKITLPKSLAGIGTGAFMGCDSLCDVVIPEGVLSIGNSAFSFCGGLTKAVALGDDTVFGSNVFQYTGIGHDGIYGRSGSTAQTYAEAQSLPFHIVCIVSFETGEGSAVPDLYAAEGDTLSEPMDPTLSGFDFGGWYKDEECTDDFTFGGDTVSGDTILYAKWSPIVCPVSIAAIEGVTAPERGASPVSVITETEQYTGTVTWNPADHPFAAGTVYTATITLTPKAGYTLSGVAVNFFTVAGAASVSNAADSGVITAVFPETEAVPPQNTIPNRRSGVPPTASASVTVNTPYSLDLATIFEDADGDPLTYKVSVNEVYEIAADTEFVYIPVSTGTTAFSFRANDGTADSADTYTVALTAGTAQAPTYTIVASAGSGGSISPSGSVYVVENDTQVFIISPDSGYEIASVTVDGTGQGAVSAYTFTNVTVNHTISAAFTRESSGDGGGGGSAPQTPTYNAGIKSGNGAETALPVTVDRNAGTATVAAGPGQLASGGSVITMPRVPDVDTYSVGIPVSDLSASDGQGALTLKTDAGSVTIPSDMLTGALGVGGSKAEIAIGQGDKSTLPEDVKDAIGSRPLIQLSLSIDGKQTDWSNPSAPVTVSIAYTPTAEELAHPESIVIWYIDGSGNVVTIPNGHYDPATGAVTFSTTHFSSYAVGYNKVSFNDVAPTAWYFKAVSFLAARDITGGTGGGNFSPDAALKRGDFLVLLMKAYGISPDADSKDNFADAGEAYYTGYLAEAKWLGITSGTGGNLYAPNREITRQEMFTLLYNALKVIGELPQGDSGRTLSDFSDAGQIGPFAKDAMALLVKAGTVSGSGGKLSPTGTTTRAEMAQVLFNLLGK